MTKLVSFLIILSALSLSALAQVKGVDPQNRQIQRDATKGTDRGRDVTRSWDFGEGKTLTRERLENPQRLRGRRDLLIAQVLEIVQEMKLTVDAEQSRLDEGLIVTEPFVFAKGAVITRSELTRYSDIVRDSMVWTRARYTLTVEVQSVDGSINNVAVVAKIEGRSENGLRSEWSDVPSNGTVEEEFLVKLVELVTGKSPYDLD